MGDQRPAWLGEDALGWIETVLADVGRFDGQPWRVWSEARESRLPIDAPPAQVDLVLDVLEDGFASSRPLTRPLPRERRLALYDAAAAARRAGTFDRARIVGAQGDADLFADLPSERRIQFALPTPAVLRCAANLLLARRALRKAVTVRIVLYGGANGALRLVRLRRLMCVARREDGALTLEITGVFTLFRRTAIYGRAFASLLSALAACDSFVLRADLAGGGVLRLQTGDPIAAPGAPQRYDSKLEAAFARDVTALGGWSVLREPEPVEVGDALVFPDFAVWQTGEPEIAWLIEIVGFWTPEYLREKLERLGRTGRRDLVLCIDRRLGCAEADLPPELPVVWFDRRIDAAAVLARLTPPAVSLALGDYFLDFAGRRSDAVHDRLAALRPGDTLAVVPRNGNLYLDARDGEVAALANHAAGRWRPRLGEVTAARVVRLVERRAVDVAAPWRARLVVDRWLVPLVAFELRR